MRYLSQQSSLKHHLNDFFVVMLNLIFHSIIASTYENCAIRCAHYLHKPCVMRSHIVSILETSFYLHTIRWPERTKFKTWSFISAKRTLNHTMQYILTNQRQTTILNVTINITAQNMTLSHPMLHLNVQHVSRTIFSFSISVHAVTICARRYHCTYYSSYNQFYFISSTPIM